MHAKTVGIHQPNFFPWLGYFNKLAHADEFVFLDSVQFSKAAGTWSNRVRLQIHGEPRWVTMPVVRDYHGVQVVRDMRTVRSDWRERMLKTIRSAYGRAAHFDVVFPFLEPLVANPTDVLVEYNVAAIRAIVDALDLRRARLTMASELGVAGRSTSLLVSIVTAVRGTTYLCGDGASGYQDDQQFREAGIDLLRQQFRHPVYEQPGDAFLPGLSVIDALMHCGFEGARRLVLASTPGEAVAVARR